MTMVREGLRYGRLVISHEDTPYYWRGRFARRRWACDCDCGGTATVREDRLKAETTLSCGCLRDDASRERQYRHGGKAGGRAAPEYQVWQALLHRQQEAAVCRRWRAANGRGYAAFLEDMGPRPDAAHRLVRRNLARAYSPANCAVGERARPAAARRATSSNTAGGWSASAMPPRRPASTTGASASGWNAAGRPPKRCGPSRA